jgi:hypothetical protein
MKLEEAIVYLLASSPGKLQVCLQNVIFTKMALRSAIFGFTGEAPMK